MQTLVLGLLQVSLFLTPVLVLLLFLMPRLGRRYSPQLRCVVWILLAVRLLIPAILSLRSLLRLTPVANLLDQIDQNAVLEAIHHAMQAGEEAATGAQATNLRAAPRLLAILWLAGFALFWAYHLAAHLLSARRLRRWSTPVEEPGVKAQFHFIKDALSIRQTIELRCSAFVQVPMLCGFIRPKLYLPTQFQEPEALAHIFTHELHHYKRGDLWYKLLLLLVNAVHWFNPAIYLMLRQAELDMESACDSDVLLGQSGSVRRQYGLTILSFADKASPPSSLTTNFYGGNKQMKLRFSEMLDRSTKKSGVFFLGMVLVTAVLCGAWVEPAAAEPAPAQPSGNALWQPHYSDEPDVQEDAAAAREASPQQEEIRLEQDDAVLAWPVPGHYTITSNYGQRFDGKDFHTGIDISGADIDGAPVIAADGGRVYYVNRTETSGVGYGIYLIVEHDNGLSTLYGQLSEITVEQGQRVERGQEIAKVGATGYATGPNLHFEVRLQGTYTSPIPYLTPQDA